MLAAALLALAFQQTVELRFKVTIPIDPPPGVEAMVGRQRRWLLLTAPTVNLRWPASDDLKTPPQAGAGYRVYKALGGGPFTLLRSGVEARALTDKAVKKGQTYRYYVTAMIGNVESKPSPNVTLSDVSPALPHVSAIGGLAP